MRIFKYDNNFVKGYAPNRSEEVFVIKKVKNTLPWTYLIEDVNSEKIIGTFYGKEFFKKLNRVQDRKINREKRW